LYDSKGNLLDSVRVYPENNAEVEMQIFIMELVKLNIKNISNKIKCVVWDLDNTLWKGILSEDNSNELTLRDGILETIKQLDDRGVIQSIASKNDYEFAWSMLKKLNISEYFLYPAINWGQKSSNILQIAKLLNINADTFLFVDDSEFEREEVLRNAPGVRVCDENKIFELLNSEWFDFEITEDSKNRRKMYQTEMLRTKVKEEFNNDYKGFIKSCEIEIEFLNVIDDEIVSRCFELVHRTNQLNLSGNKYSKENFLDLLKCDFCHNFAIKCKDKFGSYGIVAFVQCQSDSKKFLINEMAVSCRIAKKYIEDVIIMWIINRYNKEQKYKTLIANYKKTPRNNPMLETFKNIGFELIDKHEGLVLDIEKYKSDIDIIKINEGKLINE